MKCLSCDCILSDFEATRKSAVTGQYIDLCNTCFKPIENSVEVIENHLLSDYIGVEDSFSDEEVDENDEL
jgi:hypothetical protein